MIQVYADGELVYDSRLPDYTLLGLSATVSVDKAGTASIQMPPNHPAYDKFTGYKTLVEIYREGLLLFRGRALYPTDDFYNRRTITCEGERCFLRDGTHRPYMYQDGPSAIFAAVIGLYNAQVEDFKRFVVGEVTVTDPNNYIRLESTEAEQFSETIDKLVERCGGYIVFTTNTSGERVINWYADLNYASYQAIEFGENLLDFARDGANTDLATVIIPYGAKDETTGARVDITSVEENGNDCIQGYDAVALRGVISRAVYWDDVTEPANLLAKAQQYLAKSKLFITSLELSAVDLSAVDSNIDTFQVGDTVTVRSKPHSVDDSFLLMSRTYNLLDPSKDKVVLGKDRASLVGADVAGDRNNRGELYRVEHNIKKDYQLNIAAAIQEATVTLSTMIEQTSEAIRLEVSETYTTGEELESMISTRITQLSDSITFQFEELQTQVNENDAEMRAEIQTISSWIRFENGDIILGESGSDLTLRQQNDRISFLDSGVEVAYISNKKLVVTDGHFLTSLRVGNLEVRPRANGNTSLIRVGG